MGLATPRVFFGQEIERWRAGLGVPTGPGTLTGRTRGRATPHVRVGVSASRRSPRACRGRCPHAPRSTSRRRRHGRDAGPSGRCGPTSRQHYPSRSGRYEGVGGCDAGRPAGTDRCKDLHREGHQDDGNEIPQPPPHQKPPLRHRLLIMQGSPKSRSGSRQLLENIGPRQQNPLMSNNQMSDIPGLPARRSAPIRPRASQAAYLSANYFRNSNPGWRYFKSFRQLL